MKTLQIDSVAVFILATTKSFGGVTSMVSSYQSRMMEIAETWTKPMEHVYFVMGSNKFDDEFLKDECDYMTSFGDEPRAEAATGAAATATADGRRSRSLQQGKGNRKLLARTAQTPSVNRTDQYLCDYSSRLQSIMSNDSSSSSFSQQQYLQERHDLNVLYVGNCTGEYFGIGPACRYGPFLFISLSLS
jgi:hypothetical protein